MICVKIGLAIVCTSGRLLWLHMQPSPSEHAAPARQAPIGVRKASFRKEFQNFGPWRPACEPRPGCRQFGQAFAPAAAHTQPMGEYRLSYTTLGLVALALAVGSGSGSGLGSSSGVRSGLRSGGAAGELTGSPRIIDG